MQANGIAVPDRVRPLQYWAVWSAWSVFLGASVALFANTVLFGRLPLWAIIRGWPRSATLTILLVVVVVWWEAYGLLSRGRGNLLQFAVVPAIPLLLGTTVPLTLIYSSDLINHYFYYAMVHLHEPKTLTLLLLVIITTLLLQLIHIQLAAGRPLETAWKNMLSGAREPLTLVLLGALGYLQVSTYLDSLYADFINRYWPIADALITGFPYPVAVVARTWPGYFTEGGLAPYLVDLPIYPVTVATSFLAFGHNMVAAYMPTIVSNITLPIFFFLLSRELFRSRVVALSMVGVVMLFPPLRLYALNWTGPDPVFYVLSVVSCWLYVKVVKGNNSSLTWSLLGLSTAAMTLTRPEGIAYALTYVFVALTMHVRSSRKIAMGSLFLVPIGAFSLFMMIMFRMLWPRNWMGSIGVMNIVGNGVYLSRGPSYLAAQAMHLSEEELLALIALLLFVSLAGTLYLLRTEWRVAMLFVPAWVNLLMVFVIDPRVSGALRWDDFFRHISYPLPLLALAAGMIGESMSQLAPRRYSRLSATVVLNLVLFWVVTWNIHLMSEPNFSYGADAGNILGTETRLNFVDLMTHSFELPVLQFGKVDGYWSTTSWGDAFWTYPGFLKDFFADFDTVGHATGVAYETGSLYIYLAALALTLAPTSGKVSIEP